MDGTGWQIEADQEKGNGSVVSRKRGAEDQIRPRDDADTI